MATIKWWLVAGIVIVLVGLSPPTHSHAATGTPGHPYTVTPVLPADNQDHASYFKLAVRPHQHRRLRLKIANQGKTAQRYDVVARIATTNSNGIVDYSRNNRAKMLPAQATALFAPQAQTVRVPAQATRTVTVELTVPAHAFKGVMLAGLTVREHTTATALKATKGTGVVARAEYVVALEFYTHRPINLGSPDLTVHRAQYQLAQAYPQVALAMVNRTPALVSQGRLHATLTTAAGKKVRHFQRNDLLFAPQSQFTLGLDLGSQALAAGQYTLTGTLKTRGGFTYPFTLPLTVTRQNVRQVTRHGVVKASARTFNWLWAVVGGLSGLVLVLALVIWRLLRRTASTELPDSEA